ncbi:MAG: MerR family transcriptional regulator [Aeromicrobium sp.]
MSVTTTEFPSSGISISAAAEASGLSVDTLRYYEREGLTLDPPDRSASGQRRYTESDVRWFGTLVMLRKTGMPIRDIRAFVALYRKPGSEQERMDILTAHREHVLADLVEVQAHLAAIEHKIDFYCTIIRDKGNA